MFFLRALVKPMSLDTSLCSYFSGVSLQLMETNVQGSPPGCECRDGTCGNQPHTVCSGLQAVRITSTKRLLGFFFSPCSAVMKGKNVEFIIIYDLKYRVVQCVVRRTEKPAADLKVKSSTLGPVLAPDGQPGQGAPEQELEIPG